MAPLVLGPLLKALMGKLPMEHPVVNQVIVAPEAMVLTAETLAMEHPMVTQVIAILEVIALTVETRVMTDHPAMETVGLSAMGTAEAMVEVMVVAMVEVMVVAMVEVMVVAMAEVMDMVETSRPDDLVFKKLYGSL